MAVSSQSGLQFLSLGLVITSQHRTQSPARPVCPVALLCAGTQVPLQDSVRSGYSGLWPRGSHTHLQPFVPPPRGSAPALEGLSPTVPSDCLLSAGLTHTLSGETQPRRKCILLKHSPLALQYHIEFLYIVILLS